MKVVLLNPHNNPRRWAPCLFFFSRWRNWASEMSNTFPSTESVGWDSVIDVCLHLEFLSALGKPRAQKLWWIWSSCALRANCPFQMCLPLLRYQHQCYLGFFDDLPYFLPILSYSAKWMNERFLWYKSNFLLEMKLFIFLLCFSSQKNIFLFSWEFTYKLKF